mmetsp:Transcript_68055/g.195339  ORF Transcript_68055/g.195339 Transcript_68055/m.195339 type:complete len:104 (-) Transcript_68055:855-1166(-)
MHAGGDGCGDVAMPCTGKAQSAEALRRQRCGTRPRSALPPELSRSARRLWRAPVEASRGSSRWTWENGGELKRSWTWVTFDCLMASCDMLEVVARGPFAVLSQ